MDAPPIDALLDECAWLRRLAGHLVGDADGAEDVAQETWLAAARAGGRPSRGWLSVVARRAAARWRRGERRRRERETVAARDADDAGGARTSDEDVVERIELARRVAQELQGLPEPYRRTLYLRYYEGLEPATIAEREGVPAGTVRWRALRGRELLRAALVRDGRSWEQWSVLLGPFVAAAPGAPPLVGAGTLSVVGGGVALSVKWTLAGTLAGALAATGTWLSRAPAPATGADGAPLAIEERARADEAPPTSSPARATNDESRTAEPGAAAGAPDPVFGVIGFGRVTDDTGAPVPAAQPVLEDDQARLATGTAGADGGWSLAGLAPGAHELSLEVDGYVPHRERVEVPAARSWRHDVTLRRGRRIPVRFEDSTGAALGVDSVRDPARFLGVVATSERPGARIAGVRQRVVARHGVGRYASRAEYEAPTDLDLRYQGVLHLNAPPPVWVSLVYRDAVLETRSLAGTEDELVFPIDEDELRATHGEVRVRLVDHGGAAVTTPVELRLPSGGVTVRGELEGGQTVFRDVPPGSLELRTARGSSALETLERDVRVPAGATLDLGTIRLGPRVPFRVRVVDERGAPLATRVYAVRPELTAGVHDLGSGGGTTGPDGWLEVTGLGPGPTLLRAGGSDGHTRVAREVDTSTQSSFELVVPRGTEVVLAGRAPSGETLVLEGADGAPLYAGYRLPRSTYLAPGRYVLVRSLDDTTLERRPIDVGTERTVVRWPR